jgi:hypothetical protein
MRHEHEEPERDREVEAHGRVVGVAHRRACVDAALRVVFAVVVDDDEERAPVRALVVRGDDDAEVRELELPQAVAAEREDVAQDVRQVEPRA